MPDIQPLDTIHAAVVTLLATVGECDLGRKPDGGGWQGDPGLSPFEPYTIVWGAGARPEGQMSSLHAQGHAVVQLSTFGASPQSAGARAQTNRESIFGLTIAGRTVSSIVHLMSRGPTENTDAGVDQAVWMVVDQFDIWTT